MLLLRYQLLDVVPADAHVPPVASCLAGTQHAVRHSDLHEPVVLLFPHDGDVTDHRIPSNSLQHRVQRKRLLAPVRRAGRVRRRRQQHLQARRMIAPARVDDMLGQRAGPLPTLDGMENPR